MRLFTIDQKQWPEVVRSLGLTIRQDGLICHFIEPGKLTPIKCIYCSSVLHLRNIGILTANTGVCKNFVCLVQSISDDDEDEN